MSIANNLMTKTVAKALAKAAAANNATVGRIDHDAQPVVVKYFTPDAQCTWFILDGEQGEYDHGTDWRLFGLCDLGMGFPELGYVMLSELQAIRGKFRLRVERDLYWTGTLADAKKRLGVQS